MSTVSVSVNSITQYTAGAASTISGGGRVGSSHTGSEFTAATAYTMEICYAIKFSSAAKKLNFNLSYTLAMNSASIVSGQAYRYGIGTSTSAPSSYNVFTWDTSNMRANGLYVYGDFAADTTYYLWLFYDWHNQNNCYVSGVDITSISGDTVGAQPAEATITVNSAKGYVSSSNNWTSTYSKTSTNTYLISDNCSKSTVLGFRFKSDKPLTKLALSVSWTSNAATVSYRVNQSPSPHTTPFLVSDKAMSGTGKTTTATITYSFAANTDYWIWMYTSSTTNSRNPTITLTPTPVKYSVTLPTGTGYTASAVFGYASPVAYGDDFKFTVTLDPAYIKGSSFSVSASGTTLTESNGAYTISNITSAKTVTVAGVELGGLVYIFNGQEAEAYRVYIANGESWEQFIPYIANGESFELYSGDQLRGGTANTSAVAGVAIAGIAIIGTEG